MHFGGSSCCWIEGDDHIERLRRGEEVHCCRPVRRPGEPYCAAHRARAYLVPGAPDFEEQRVGQLELTPGEYRRYVALRRAGLSFARAVDLATRPLASLLIPRRLPVAQRLAA